MISKAMQPPIYITFWKTNASHYIESLLSVSKVITGKTMIQHQKSSGRYLSLCLSYG